MPRKCSAFGCNSGYASNPEKITVYAFPKKDVDLRTAWGRAMPNQLPPTGITDSMGLCAIHFPNCKKWKTFGKFQVPDEPTSQMSPHHASELKQPQRD